MRHAGGLRIDHAMSLERLYWVPKGGSPQDGGYVQYPMDDLIGVLALESHRNECLVVGEDLGTVKEGFRERMAEARILSYRVLLFEKEESGFLPPSAYPKLALSTASSHDLPTLRGWWEEVDLDLKGKLGLTKEDALPKSREERDKDRQAAVEALRAEGLLQEDGWPTTEEFIAAAHVFLARTPAVLAMAQIDDIAEEPEQVNLPGTMPDQYPSWSRRLSLGLEAMREDPRWVKLAEQMEQERG
jgi:4-alpha-glucanotransferase